MLLYKGADNAGLEGTEVPRTMRRMWNGIEPGNPRSEADFLTITFSSSLIMTVTRPSIFPLFVRKIDSYIICP